MTKFLVVLAFAVPMVAWRGYVLSILWGWFVAVRFDLPYLSIPEALGLAAVIQLVVHRSESEKQSEERSGSSVAFFVASGFLDPALILLFGWVLTRFMP